jgi:PPOX class probable F420-dependent enzyme
MSVKIPESFRDLLEKPVVVTLATVMPDGQPQLSAVWYSYDGEYLLVNSARGRQKDKNMQERPQVSILAVDPQNPYRYLEVRGEVVEITEKGAKESIDELARKYTGSPSYYGHVAPAELENKEVRVLYKIRPTHVTTMPPQANQR